MPNEETKLCKYCGREFPLTNEYFAWANKLKGKYQDRCKECFSKYMHERWLMIKTEDGERMDAIKANRLRLIKAEDNMKKGNRMDYKIEAEVNLPD